MIPLRMTKMLFGAFLGLTLVFAGCPLEEDPLKSKPAEEEEGEEESLENEPELDERLYGVWEWRMNTMVERFTISPTGGSLGTLSYGSNVYSSTVQENFAGNIVYAENFSSSAGIIIIQYLSGHKQEWIDWDNADPGNNHFPLRPDNPSGDFYGIYFLNLNNGGTRVFLACTNDQRNNYGPTETATLAAAKAKFTLGNMNQLMDLSVGDPQDKVEDF
jgi:hypothetical protein